MKYLLSAILCLTLIIASVVPALAVGTPTITVQSAQCDPGESVTVDVTVSNNPGIVYLEMSTTFAPELGEPTVANGSIFSDFTKGRQYVWTADEDVTANGKLVSLTFNIPENTAPGEYNVGFIFRSAYNYDEQSVNFTVVPATVTIGSPTPSTSATITVQSAEVNPGESATLDVNISENPGITYLELSTAFAPELGNPTVTNGSIFSDFTKGRQYVWTADEDVADNGKLVSLTFNVPENIAPGDYSVGFVFRSAYNYDEQGVNFTVVPATVTVGSPTPSESATITVQSAEVNPGDNVTLDVNISDNPGITYLELSTAFAPELGNPNVTNGSIFSDFTKGRQYVWTADEDVNTNGKLVSLTFNVPADTAPGDYNVSFIFRSAYNYDEQSVAFTVVPAIITVKEKQDDKPTYGNLDGDNAITAVDALFILQASIDLRTLTPQQRILADVNGDENIDSVDALYILQYSVGIITSFPAQNQ